MQFQIYLNRQLQQWILILLCFVSFYYMRFFNCSQFFCFVINYTHLKCTYTGHKNQRERWLSAKKRLQKNRNYFKINYSIVVLETKTVIQSNIRYYSTMNLKILTNTFLKQLYILKAPLYFDLHNFNELNLGSAVFMENYIHLYFFLYFPYS